MTALDDEVKKIEAQDIQSRMVILVARVGIRKCERAGKKKCVELDNNVCPPCESRFITKEAARIAEMRKHVELKMTTHIICEVSDTGRRGNVTAMKTTGKAEFPVSIMVEWHDRPEKNTWCNPHAFKILKGDEEFSACLTDLIEASAAT